MSLPDFVHAVHASRHSSCLSFAEPLADAVLISSIKNLRSLGAAVVGAPDGLGVGDIVGLRDGFADGLAVGVRVGASVGFCEGV